MNFVPSPAKANVLIVGERNPYGEDPEHALYPIPKHASGDRLCKILGLDADAYLARYDRVNLCVGPWSLPAAREVALHLRLRRDLRDHRLVLLGRKVQLAFRVEAALFELAQLGGRPVLVLPHPSGLNRLWDVDRDARTKARRALKKLETAPW